MKITIINGVKDASIENPEKFVFLSFKEMYQLLSDIQCVLESGVISVYQGDIYQMLPVDFKKRCEDHFEKTLLDKINKLIKEYFKSIYEEL